MKDTVYWSSSAWDAATACSLSKSCKNLLPFAFQPVSDESADADAKSADDASSSHDGQSMLDLFQRLGYEAGSGDWQTPEWAMCDQDDPGFAMLDDDEVVATVLERQFAGSDNDNNKSSSEDDSATPERVSPAAACEALSVTLSWLEAQGVDPSHLMLVRKWRDQAALKRSSQRLCQTKVSSYLKPSLIELS